MTPSTRQPPVPLDLAQRLESRRTGQLLNATPRSHN